jgi:hypothetical protein
MVILKNNWEMEKTIIMCVIFACVLVSFSGCGHNQLLQTDTKDIPKDNTADITEPTEAMTPTEEQMRPHQISAEGKNPNPKATSFFSWENWKRRRKR